MAATDRRVREVFIELADTVVMDFDIIDFLERLAGRCAELPGVSGCGVMLADHLGALNLVAASTEEARLVELAQLQAAQGPCLDAYWAGRPVHQSDLAGPGQSGRRSPGPPGAPGSRRCTPCRCGCANRRLAR